MIARARRRRRQLLLEGLGALALAPVSGGRALAAPAGAGPAGPPRYDLERRLPAPRRVLEIGDDEALAAALAGARPGDHLVLAPGRYAAAGLALGLGGIPDAPLVIRAGRSGGAALAGPVLLAADHVCLFGLDFLGPDALTVEGDHDAVLRCTFRDVTGVVLRRGASHNRIGWNSFVDLPFRGGEERGNAVRLDPRPGDPRPMAGNRIYRNYFSTAFGRDDNRDNVCVYVGLSRTLTLKLPPLLTLVEYNLFDRIDYKSAVRVKAHGNLVRSNTALGPGRDSRRRNRAQFSQRQGQGNRWHANWAEDTRGFVVHGQGQELLGNVAAGSARIDLSCGSDRNKPACSHSLLAANEGRCRIGNRDFGEPVSEPCRGNWLEGHRPGPDAVELTEWQAETSVAPETARAGLPRAVRLGRDEVGAGAAGAPAVA